MAVGREHGETNARDHVEYAWSRYPDLRPARSRRRVARARPRRARAARQELDAGCGADLRLVENAWPSGAAASASPTVERKAGSALVVAVLRWLARGSAIACGSVIPRSSRSSRSWSTVVMIIEPPGEPSARNGLPSVARSSGTSSCAVACRPRRGSDASVESKLKSVSSLLSRKPQPGTTRP